MLSIMQRAWAGMVGIEPGCEQEGYKQAASCLWPRTQKPLNLTSTRRTNCKRDWSTQRPSLAPNRLPVLVWAHRRAWSSLASVLKHGDQHTPLSPPNHQPAKSRFKHEKQKTSSKMTKHRWQSQPFWGHNYRIIITFWQDDRRKKFSELGVICFTWNWTIHAVRG